MKVLNKNIDGSSNSVLHLAVTKYFSLLYAINAIVIGYLNYDSELMSGILPYYYDFKRIILSGFDPSAGLVGTPTFPMWGYGWVFLLTENRLAIFIAQNLLAYFAIWYLVNSRITKKYLPEVSLLILKALILVSIPWYAIHSTVTPYSIGISLLILSLIFLLEALEINDAYWTKATASGLLFGLALNFRSDYLYFVLIIFAIICIFKGLSSKTGKIFSLWIAMIMVCLLPWSLYTKSVTGTALLSSTNAGQTLFTGLGGLPGNKWGITNVDGDPRMVEEIKIHFGEDKPLLTYETDVFLKKRFLELIKEDPLEYLKKTAVTGVKVIISGVYIPEFYEIQSCKPFPKCKDEFIYDSLTHPLRSLFESSKGLRYLATYLSIGLGGFLIAFSFASLPIGVYRALRQKNLLLLLSISVIMYQWAINAFAFHMRLYTTNAFVFHLINVAFVAGLLWSKYSIHLAKERVQLA